VSDLSRPLGHSNNSYVHLNRWCTNAIPQCPLALLVRNGVTSLYKFMWLDNDFKKDYTTTNGRDSYIGCHFPHTMPPVIGQSLPKGSNNNQWQGFLRSWGVTSPIYYHLWLDNDFQKYVTTTNSRECYIHVCGIIYDVWQEILWTKIYNQNTGFQISHIVIS
jgi:hypothetical protein